MLIDEIRTLTAGADIKIGQMLYSETMDEDSNEPLTLVYPMIEGKQPIGIALSNASAWQQVKVGARGQIGNIVTLSGVAGENLRSGFVYFGKDGKIYNGIPKRTFRNVVAGADIEAGQPVIENTETGLYFPVAEGEKYDGRASHSIHKGGLFEMLVRADDSDAGNFAPPPLYPY